MSIQPFSPALPPSEPAPLRRRAPETEAKRDDTAFTLPEEPAAKPEKAEQKPEPQRTDAKTADDGAKPGTEKPVAEPKPAVPAADATKTGEPAPAVVTQPAAPVAAQDIGALVSIAVAEESGEADASKDKTKSSATETESGEAKAPADGAALPLLFDIVPAAAPQPVVISPEAALLAAAAGPKAAPAAAGSTQPQPALSQVGLAAGAAIGADGLQAQVAAPAPTAGKPDGATPSTDARKAGDAKVETSTSSAATDAANPVVAEFKPLEALQPALNPVDLSAMLAPHRGGAKTDLAAGPVGADAATNAAQAVVHAQTDASGSPVALHVVPLEIGLRALSGAKRFEIRLDPAELGRIDVKLDISDTGEVSAKLVVDRVETMHMLQRDSRTLERAFEQAGLKPSDAGVDITLRDPSSDQPGFRQNRQDDEAPRRSRSSGGSADNDDITIAAQPAPVRRLLRLGGVDLSI